VSFTLSVVDLPFVSYFISTVNESFAPAEVILPLLPRFNSSALTEPTAWTLNVLNGTEERKSIVCYCAKCGSTSISNELYEIIFGKTWPYTGKPWIQDLNSKRWKGLSKKDWKIDFGKTPSFAVIRDPKERIMSAFRSKVGCQGSVDISDRSRMVPKLLRLAGLPTKFASNPLDGSSGLCLNETVYLQALFMIHMQALQGKLNVHFLPQHLHCFRHAPPSKWTVVTTVESPKARCDLELVVLGKSAGKNCSLIKLHGTSKKARTSEALSAIDEARLDAITRKEYQFFGSYLN